MVKKLFVTFAIAAIAITAAPGAAGAATGSTSPCEGKGGAIFAQASGVDDELSVEVACADGSWELY